jgi:uncharacterized protein with HEPN domain
MARKIGPVLDEILNAIDGIQAALAGKSCVNFEQDWLLRHGVQRGIEIISEASRHLPASLKAQYKDVRWSALAGIGNVLRHEYHSISDRVIWDAIRDELPPLHKAVEMMIAGLKE